MKQILLTLFATAALAVPGAALAHGGHFGHHHHATLAKLAGTGTSFAGASATASGSIAMSAKLGTGTFSAAITTDLAKATTRSGDHGTLSCAPSTAALTLTGATASNTLSGTLTGKTCTWTPKTGTAVSAFFGRGSVTGGGALADLTGKSGKAFLMQKSDGTVKGAVFAGSRGERSLLFSVGERHARHAAGDCGH
jgi:hypothetical protein